MPPRRKRVNLFDIARAAGVSVAAVSRVMGGGRPTIPPAKFDQVLRAVRKFSYHPDAFAFPLGEARTGAIAFAAPMGTRPWIAFVESEILRGISAAAARRGLDLHYVLVPPKGRFPTRDHARAVDGTIVFDFAIDSPAIRPLLDSDHLVVLVNRQDETLPWVAVDNHRGARLAIEHLTAMGHERIAVVLGEGPVSREREAGAREAFRRAGLEPAFLADARWNRKKARDLIGRHLFGPRPPTAVFAFSDWMAHGVISAAREEGLRIPRDLSVVGFDDAFVSEFESPPLTTVQQPFDAMGARGVALLAGLATDQPADRAQILLPPKLILRSTTAPPRRR